jgi:hypothetical protein
MNRPSYAVIKFLKVDTLQIQNNRFFCGTEIWESGLWYKPDTVSVTGTSWATVHPGFLIADVYNGYTSLKMRR